MGSADRPPRPRQDRERETPPPGVGPRADEPALPEIDPKDVPRAVKAELKSLPKDLAEIVAAHLVAAGELIEVDPELAYAHAEAAKRRAARIPVAREAFAETAYAAGHFDVALQEFRALRRMTGSPDYLPVLADCERALGRPEAALRLVREGEQSVTDPALLVELRIVQAGARADSGQRAEALRLLRSEIESPRGAVPRTAAARLRYAYAALLLEQGDVDAAQDWFTASLRLDPEATDALDRLDELDGVVLITDFEDDDESDEDSGTGEPPAEDHDERRPQDEAPADTGEPLDLPSDDLDVPSEELDPRSELDLPSEEEDIAEVLREIDGGSEA